MNILVIGNGFDIEHELPTTYKDFLDFIQGIRILSTKSFVLSKGDINFYQKLDGKIGHEVDENIKKFLMDYDCYEVEKFDIWKEDKYVKELIKCANNNIWIKYFLENVSYENKGWIDFELEISNVIQSLDNAHKLSIYYKKNEKHFPEYNKRDLDKEEIVSKIVKYTGLDIKIFQILEENLQSIIKVLIQDLDDLTYCLEIYLEECINKLPLTYIAPDIRDFKYDRIISFNYTKTCEKLYECVSDLKIKELEFKLGKIEPCEYIHGKADIGRNKNENNMVLGIDEYLDDELKNVELDFIEFKKYYQRIYKKTGVEYRKWIKYMRDQKENNIYIFGHSLDITDKDILRQLIMDTSCKNNNYENNTRITIFYHNKKANAQQIANLVKIIGQDELIDRVSGENPTIIFKEKQEKEILK